MNAQLVVPIRGRSDMGRMGRGGVSVWCTGLLVEARSCEHSDSGVVVATGASTLHCMVAASASLMSHVGRVPGLAAVEMHQGSSLTESIELVSEKTSQKVVSTSSAILAHQSSCLVAILIHQFPYFLANPSHSWTSSQLCWALVWVMHCSYIRARLRLGPTSVCKLSS